MPVFPGMGFDLMDEAGPALTGRFQNGSVRYLVPVEVPLGVSLSTLAPGVPSVSPGLAAEHFNNTECFCFTPQKLAGFEKRDMPLRFIIDNAISENIEQITMLYTFFSIDEG